MPSSSTSSTILGSGHFGSSSMACGEDRMKGHALFTSMHYRSSIWLLDSTTSHHMASSNYMFSNFEHFLFPDILMGNNTYVSVNGSGSFEVDGGIFNNVLCVRLHYLLTSFPFTRLPTM